MIKLKITTHFDPVSQGYRKARRGKQPKPLTGEQVNAWVQLKESRVIGLDNLAGTEDISKAEALLYALRKVAKVESFQIGKELFYDNQGNKIAMRFTLSEVATAE